MLRSSPLARGTQGSRARDCKDIIDNINLIINIMKVKTKEYEVPKVDVLHVNTEGVLCSSPGASTESIDDTGAGESAWGWVN